MSAIDDTRKVLQDFLTPEVREIKTRFDALETRMDDRFDHVTAQLHQADQLAIARHEVTLAELRGISNYNEIRDRLSKLEAAKESVHQ